MTAEPSIFCAPSIWWLQGREDPEPFPFKAGAPGAAPNRHPTEPRANR